MSEIELPGFNFVENSSSSSTLFVGNGKCPPKFRQIENAFSKDEFRENDETFAVSSVDPLQSSYDQIHKSIFMVTVYQKS